jgi:hypothetical protein
VIISFEGPVSFAAADEDQFFGWLSSLPEFQSVRGIGTTLELALSHPVQPETVRQLLVVFRRWHLGVTPLLALRSPETNGFALWDTGIGEASATGA